MLAKLPAHIPGAECVSRKCSLPCFASAPRAEGAAPPGAGEAQTAQWDPDAGPGPTGAGGPDTVTESEGRAAGSAAGARAAGPVAGSAGHRGASHSAEGAWQPAPEQLPALASQRCPSHEGGVEQAQRSCHRRSHQVTVGAPPDAMAGHSNQAGHQRFRTAGAAADSAAVDGVKDAAVVVEPSDPFESIGYHEKKSRLSVATGQFDVSDAFDGFMRRVGKIAEKKVGKAAAVLPATANAKSA